MEHQYIYCMTTNSMPGLVKIGKTKNLETRISQANKSNTFGPPDIYKYQYAKKVDNMNKTEKTIHKLLESIDKREERGEFFRVSVDTVKYIFELVPGNDVDISEINEKQEEKRKKKTCKDIKQIETKSKDKLDTKSKDKESKKYEVEKVVGIRKKGDGVEYLIKWVGYEKRNWVREEDCECHDLIREFLKSREEKSNSKVKKTKKQVEESDEEDDNDFLRKFLLMKYLYQQ